VIVLRSLRIQKDGAVAYISLAAGNPETAVLKPIIDAVRLWRFQPVSVHGQLTDAVALIDVHY